MQLYVGPFVEGVSRTAHDATGARARVGTERGKSVTWTKTYLTEARAGAGEPRRGT